MSLPISSSITGSLYGAAQPPYSKPPRRSSSGSPGACITPSSVTFSTTMILRIAVLLRGLQPARYRLVTLYTNQVRPDRHRREEISGGQTSAARPRDVGSDRAGAIRRSVLHGDLRPRTGQRPDFQFVVPGAGLLIGEQHRAEPAEDEPERDRDDARVVQWEEREVGVRYQRGLRAADHGGEEHQHHG